MKHFREGCGRLSSTRSLADFLSCVAAVDRSVPPEGHTHATTRAVGANTPPCCRGNWSGRRQTHTRRPLDWIDWLWDQPPRWHPIDSDPVQTRRAGAGPNPAAIFTPTEPGTTASNPLALWRVGTLFLISSCHQRSQGRGLHTPLIDRSTSQRSGADRMLRPMCPAAAPHGPPPSPMHLDSPAICRGGVTATAADPAAPLGPSYVQETRIPVPAQDEPLVRANYYELMAQDERLQELAGYVHTRKGLGADGRASEGPTADGRRADGRRVCARQMPTVPPDSPFRAPQNLP